jgi:D-sedoheptulose 7-phosphate isomerase
MTLFDSEWAEHIAVAEATKAALREPFARVVTACAASLKGGGKLLFFGNGGSAADAQHLATEFTVRYKADRPAIAALALTTDTSALTAAGNDLGFEHIFARQVEALGRRGDVAIGITTSGRSANVVKALSTGRAKGLVAVAFSGSGGGEAARAADHALIVPSAVTARVQEMHIALGQMLCAALEVELGLAKP